MSLYSDIKQNNKKKNAINNKTLIRNQKLLNITVMVIFSTLLFTDLLYIIKENIIGISSFANTLMIIALALEAIVFTFHVLLRFNTENQAFKYITVGIFAIPLVSYASMMYYGDLFSIILFILRLILLVGIIMVVIRNRNRDNKAFKAKHVAGFGFSAILLIAVIILLIANRNRTVEYSYDDSLGGYVVDNVLDGSSEIVFKDETIKINDFALKDAGESITIPEGVKYVSSNAFSGSDVKEVHIKSNDIEIMKALNNSKVTKVYLESNNIVIKDLNARENHNYYIRFYCAKEDVDNYRKNNSRFDTLFVPITDPGEYYIAFNSTSLPIQYAKENDLVYEPTNISTDYVGKVEFKEWSYTTTDQLGKYRQPEFPITVKTDIELTANWSYVYTININYDGGNLTEPNLYWDDMPTIKEVTKEDGNIELPELEKVGYRFDGWYSLDNPDNLFVNNIIYSQNLKDMSIKAKFSKIYILDYELNGGQLSEEDMDAEYVDGDVITPATPVRFGYEFAGWYDNANFDGDVIEKVYDLETKLYAKWDLIAPNIVLSDDVSKVYDGKASTISVDVTHPLMNSDDFELSIKWYRNEEDKSISTKNFYRVIDAENNKYRCRITITHLDNTYEIMTDYINVNIEKADYDMSDILANYANKKFEYEFSGYDQTAQITNLPVGVDMISLFAKYQYEGNFKNVGDKGNVIVNFETESPNYNVPQSVSAQVLIVQRKLTVEWDSLVHIYDETNWKPTGTLVGAIPGYPVSLQFINFIQSTNVGKYEIGIRIDDVDNYVLDDEKVSYEIVPADYTNEEFAVLADTFVYDGNNHMVELDLPSGLSIDTAKSTYAKNVSDTTVKVYFKLADGINNFKAPEPRNYNISIKPKQITYNMSSSEFVYNGKNQKPELTLNNVIGSDNVDIEITNTDTINAGTYKLDAILTGSDSNNYVLVDNGTYFVISKANYDLSGIKYINEFTYTGDYIIPTPTNLPLGLEFVEETSVGLKDVCVNGKVEFRFKNNSNNYFDIDKYDGYITINPKKITAQLTTNEFTYTGILQIPEITLLGVVGNDDVTAVVNNNSINVGDYIADIKLSGSLAFNYELIDSDLEYSINKADFDYKYAFSQDTYVTYDGLEHTPDLDISSGKIKYYNGKQILFDFDKKPINAGDYVITITFSIDENYIEKTIECGLHIAKRELELEFEKLTFEHQDTVIIPNVTNIINLIDEDKDKVNVNVYNDETSTGTHLLHIELTGQSSSNYVVNKEYYIFIDNEVRELTSGDYVITPYTGIYDGKEHTVTVTLATELQSEIEVVIDRTATNVGVYNVNISFESKITGVIISTREVSTITINPKPLDVEFKDTDLVYNGSVQIPEYTIKGVVGSDKVNVILTMANGDEPIDAGVYNNIIASLDNNNYEISGSTTLTFEISPCYVRVQWDSLDLTYAKKALKPTASIYLDDQRLYIDVDVVVDANIEVGTYVATATLNNSNYVISNDSSVEYNILPKTLKITWNERSFNYNGRVQIPTATVNPITGDNCRVVVTSNGDSILPNTYIATAALENSNYEILGGDTLKYVINKGVLTKEDVPNVPFTEVVYDGLPHIPSIDLDSIVAPDGSEIKYRANGKVDAGSWYVDIEFYVEGDKYTSYIVSSPIVISQRVLGITLKDNTFVYNGNIQKPEIICSNTVNGDSISVTVNNNSISAGKYILNANNFVIDGSKKGNYKIDGEYEYNILKGQLNLDVIFNNTTVTYNGSAQLPTAISLPDNVIIDTNNSIGVINVTDTKAIIKFALTGSKANNYEVPADVEVNMVVKPKLLTINWTLTSFGYDGLPHTPEYELIGLCNNDNAQITFNNNGAVNRGDYTIKAISLDNNNYCIEEEECNYSILIGEYDMDGVSFQDLVFTYDGKPHKSFSIDNEMLPAGVTASVSYDENDSVTYVGSHKVTIKFVGDEINYLPIPDMYAYININPKKLKISWSNTTLTYNGYYQKPSAIATDGLVNSDTCDVDVSGMQKNAGTYTATANLGNSNYEADLETQSISFTINPKPIKVTVKMGTTTGTNFNFTYDGKLHNSLSAEIDQDDLCNSDSVFDINITNNIGKLVGTYAYTLASTNPNYVPSVLSGTVEIEKLYINSWGGSSPVAHNGTATSLPYITVTINGEEVRVDSLGTPDYPVTYHFYQIQWGGKGKEVTGDIPSGSYIIDFSTNYSGISIGYYGNLSVNYINPKIRWSADGQYNSNVFAVEGNYRESASQTFTYDDTTYTFKSPLKLESGTGTISFTLDSSKTLVLFMNNGSTIKINGQSKSYTAGEPLVLELSAGSYTISKGSGSTLIYAAFLE